VTEGQGENTHLIYWSRAHWSQWEYFY